MCYELNHHHQTKNQRKQTFNRTTALLGHFLWKSCSNEKCKNRGICRGWTKSRGGNSAIQFRGSNSAVKNLIPRVDSKFRGWTRNSAGGLEIPRTVEGCRPLHIRLE